MPSVPVIVFAGKPLRRHGSRGSVTTTRWWRRTDVRGCSGELRRKPLEGRQVTLFGAARLLLCPQGGVLRSSPDDIVIATSGQMDDSFVRV